MGPSTEGTTTGALPKSRYIVFCSIAVVGCILDLATKSIMFAWLGMPLEQPTEWVWQGVFGFQTSLNYGALFGMFQGFGVVFSTLSIVAAIGIVTWLFYFRAASDLLLTTALGCITAGICGNLYDRLGLPGLKCHVANKFQEIGDPIYAVRDWIQVMIGSHSWPTFNIADCLLVSGTALLGVHAIMYRPPVSASEAADASKAAEKNV